MHGKGESLEKKGEGGIGMGEDEWERRRGERRGGELR